MISPPFRDTAPGSTSEFVINGANAVPTHKKTGAKIVHRNNHTDQVSSCYKECRHSKGDVDDSRKRKDFVARKEHREQQCDRHRINDCQPISLDPPRNGQSRPTTKVLPQNFLFMKSLTASEIGARACMKYFVITGNRDQRSCGFDGQCQSVCHAVSCENTKDDTENKSKDMVPHKNTDFSFNAAASNCLFSAQVLSFLKYSRSDTSQRLKRSSCEYR